ncbi:MAG TPA: glycosyltransferase family 39 protein [Candidatus Saccharimonadales bacterium]|jgi:4-amino-4-deoxy-L-arabinose transferase-like glycosyltransferase|nr:glycosyltransferase family 39 protein [Candidatus Saccharimonadales bacterium]
MKKSIITTILVVFLITFFGGFLRFYKITQNPPSLNGDELSFGYAAYSILKTGKDEYGVRLPLVFKSVGDYKNPVLGYLLILPVKIFGLTDFAVRFPNALVGTFSIPIFFLFLLDIFKKKKIAYIGSLFLAINPLDVYFSRVAYESLIAGLFIIFAIWAFMKLLDGKKLWAFVSAFFFTLTMYTAPAPRLFVPVFVFAALLISIPTLKKNWKVFTIFIITCLVLGLPMVYTTLFLGSGTRFNMVFLTHDIDFIRHILLKYFDSFKDIPLLFFFWIERYINYFQPDFIFSNALHMTTLDSFGLGLLYLFDIPLLATGIFAFIKKQIPHKNIFVIWLLTGIVPDSITNNLQQGGRLIHIVPVIIIITTLGLLECVKWFNSLKSLFLRILIAGAYFSFVILILIHAFLVFSVHFPNEKSESYDEGLKQVSLYISEHQSQYKEIIIDTRHGVDAPSLISNPFLYLNFYLKYDPATYQTEPKISGTSSNPYYHYNKYTFTYINWPVDSKKTDTLFIGSPWSFPSDLQGVKILDTIYLTNGHIAYYIVIPKKP